MSNVEFQRPKTKTTYGPAFRNEDTMEYMSIKLEDQLISLSIGDLKKGKEGNSELIRESVMEIKFGSMNLFLLKDIFNECFDTFNTGKKFESEAFASGDSTKLVQISDGSNINKPYGLYLVMYKDATPEDDFRNCKHKIYSFGSKKTIVGFNKTSAYKIKNRAIEAKVFRNSLDELADAAIGASQHAVKLATRYDSDRLFSGMLTLMTAQGLTFSGDFTSKKPRGMYSVVADGGSTPAAAPETYSLTKPATPSDINFEDFE